MSNDTVLVTGGTGFIGHAVVRRLLESGYRVRVLVRPTSKNLTDLPNLSYVRGDVRDLKSLEAAMTGVAYVIHLAAAKSDERNSEEINVGGAHNLIEACRIVGVRRIINISTQVANLEKKGLYASTKERADRMFHASTLPVVTLRSSLVYSENPDGVFGTIVKFSTFPMIPIFGKGEALYRPIHRDDLATVIVNALRIPDITGKIYDVAGPDLVTLNELATRIMKARGKVRPLLHLPVWLGVLAARIVSILPKPPVTVSNVLGGAAYASMDLEPFYRDFGPQPIRPFAQGLTEIFGAIPASDHLEERLLLSYVVSSVGRWKPNDEQIALLQKAFAAHHLNTPLNATIIRSKRSLASFDAASRMLHPHCYLQKKLLVAAAIAEVQPESADAFLPKNRSIVLCILRTLDIGLSALCTMILALPLVLRPRYLKQHVGAL